jgi:hypothetical protein
LIDLQSVFDTAFPNVKIKPIKRGVFVDNKKQIKVWQATAIQVHQGRQTKLFPDYTPMMPKSNLTMDDHSMWYYNNNGAITVLMWYNLTAMADTHWRKRWCRHLLGDE